MAESLPQLSATLGDRYVLEHEVGAGGMATVFLARDLKHHRQVAVKILRPELASAVGAERFLREITMTAALTHPHILPVHDSGEADGFLYYVMPYIEGESLRGRLQRERQLPVDIALQITREVADALSYAHSQGVVHRDIKPENILFQAGHALVSDFGIARAVTPIDNQRLTEAGFPIGTPGYMSPEQSQGGGDLDGRSDIYSLACVLYEMLAGDPPFQGWSPRAILARQLSEPVPRLRTVRDTVPKTVERAVLRALAIAPADRFPTVAQFAAALATPAGGRASAPATVPTLSRGPARNSIAVLPFVNLSPDPENEYFSDGMTEELISALARVEGLHVASRTSMFALKGKDEDIRMIGRQINVATVLEGSVRRADATLRVTAQLIDVADGYHLWSETYEREVKDVFAIQEEIARAIVTALKMKLVNALTLPLIDPHTANVEAYTAYLKARYFWRRKSARGLKRCIEYFEQAIAADPAYALAHAGLADSFIALGYISYLRPREAFPRAKAAAERALTLDGSLAEAHTASACVSLLYDWDWPRAERGFQQALELNARYGVARFWYASYLAAAGRSEECLAEISRAQALAPLSLMTSVNAAFALYFARRYDEAIAQGRQALDLDPTSFLAHCVLGLTYAQQSMHDRAVAALHEAVTFSGGHPLPAAGLGYAYAVAGKQDDAERVLASLQQRSQQEYVPAFGFVMVYAGLGDSNEALAWLARACEERSHWLAYVKVWPLLDDLRRDARFTAVLEKVGLR